MALFRSKKDQITQLSKSIFVTNFLDATSSQDIWNLCQSYGTVVDVYIPNRRSKAGKRFAFVRFINVDNIERLVGNLCTLWISRMHLQTNVVRFERSPLQPSRPPPPPKRPAPPALREVTEFSSINNLRVLLSNEGFSNTRIAYLGGQWVTIELRYNRCNYFACLRLAKGRKLAASYNRCNYFACLRLAKGRKLAA
nr:hypothetical protein [Tanacetum cinerariifolium]